MEDGKKTKIAIMTKDSPWIHVLRGAIKEANENIEIVETPSEPAFPEFDLSGIEDSIVEASKIPEVKKKGYKVVRLSDNYAGPIKNADRGRKR